MTIRFHASFLLPFITLVVVAAVFATTLLPLAAFAAAPTGASAVVTNSTASTVDVVVTGTSFNAFVSASSTTANATDRAKITYRSTNPSAAVVSSSTALTLTFPISIGTDKSGSLVIAADAVMDAAQVHNTTITIVNGSITDTAKPVIKTVTTEDTNTNGLIDKLTYTWTENIDTDDSAVPVAADLPTTILPDGSTAVFSSATISDPAGAAATVVVTGVTGQTTQNTAAGSTAISGDLSTKWVDGATNAAHASIATAGESITDAAAPVVVSVFPVDDATNQAKTTDLSVVFSEAMNTGSVTFSTDQAAPASFTQTWSGSDTSLALGRSSLLTLGVTYTASITAASASGGTVTTLAGLPYSWNFTTENSSGGGGGGGSHHSSGGSSSSASPASSSVTPSTSIVTPAIPLTGSAGEGSLPAVDTEMGATGPSVAALQAWLIKKGFVIPAGATGYFGMQTQGALAKYQASVGIMPSAGYFGPKTRAYITLHP